MAPKHREAKLATSMRKRQCTISTTNPESSENIVVTPASSSTTTLSRFLSLPKELRDQIYHEIWSTKQPFALALPRKSDRPLADSTYFIFKVHYAIQGTPSEPRRPSSSLRARRIWFLANKQVCEEAIDQFRRKAIWTLNDTSYEQENWRLGVWKNRITRGRGIRMGPAMLTPTEAVSIHCQKSLDIYTHGEMDSREKPVERITFRDPGLLQRLGASVSGSASLRSLALTFRVHAWASKSTASLESRPLNVDLLLLQHLDMPNLQKLQLAVKYTRGFLDDNRLVNEFRNALSEIGRELVGGGGIETSEIVDEFPAQSTLLHDEPRQSTVYTFSRI